MEALPTLDPRILGIAVHAALERIAREALPDAPADLREARTRAPLPVGWPAPERLEEILREVAVRVLEAEGIGLRGLERVLVARVRPFLERARLLEWPHPGSRVPVLAVELDDAVEVDAGTGKRRALRFRADRVDRVDDGALCLTDYKTGRPISPAVKPEKRAEHFLARVANGLDLQAAAYALSGASPGDRGRFLFLREDLAADAAEYVVRAEDTGFAEAFGRSVGTALRAWETGAFFPRLLAGDLAREPRQCSRCEVAEACVRGDSGARRRLARWIEAGSDAEAPTPAESALREAWKLGGES